ncbi:MAG: hypothetical protein AVDCRST_MAG02-861, partial [uncultured Rubrobacteraceae bacterium]
AKRFRGNSSHEDRLREGVEAGPEAGAPARRAFGRR